MSNSAELQVRSRVTIRLSVALPAKAKKKVRTKESEHKHDLFQPPLEVRGLLFGRNRGTRGDVNDRAVASGKLRLCCPNTAEPTPVLGHAKAVLRQPR